MPLLEYSKINTSDWAVNNTIRGYGNAPDTKFNEGDLDIGDGHTMRYREYGNPKGEPVLFLHGGPGADTSKNYSKFFDPAHYHIIIYDQRGSGESTPHVSKDLKAALHHNDTPHLVADIEKLRTHLGLEQMHIFGGSWGTTLALAYAEAHPDRAKSLVLRGIFNVSKPDIDYFYQGNAAEYDPAHPEAHTEKEGAYRAYLGDGKTDGMIPEQARDPRMAEAYAQAWKNYVSVIPQEKRADMVKAYHDILNATTNTPEEKLKAATAWSVWEGVTSNLSHDVGGDSVARFADPEFATAFATIENHYFYHGAFLDGTNRNQDTLLAPENIARIKHIPTYIVHGTYDQVCPVRRARDLRDALKAAGAPFVEYAETEAGHSMFERPTTETLVGFLGHLRDHHKPKAQVGTIQPEGKTGPVNGQGPATSAIS